MIPAFSRLNPDRDKIFNFSGQPSSNPKFGPPQQILRNNLGLERKIIQLRT